MRMLEKVNACEQELETQVLYRSGRCGAARKGGVKRTGHTKAKSELENAVQSGQDRDRAVRLKAKLGSKGKKKVTKQRKWKGYKSSFETWCVSGLDFWWRTWTF